MRNLNGSWIISVLCGIVVAMAVSFFAPVCLADEPNSEAQKFMDAMSPEQFADPVALDDFIRRFPDSVEARMVFAYRYSLLKRMPTIDDYNEFIAKYPERIQSQIAVHEVFKLYRLEDRVALYCDFINRYPNSPEAIVAMLRIEELLFEFVCILDTEENYDAFITSFPYAPQVKAALEKALQKAIEKEKMEFDKFLNADPKPSRDDLMDYVSGKLSSWEKRVNNYQKDNPNVAVPKNFEMQFELYMIDRQANVLSEVYGKYDHNGRVANKLGNLEITKRLDAIKQTLQSNHKELLAKLDEQTELFCKGLEQLHLDNKQLINDLRTGFNMLHKDFVAVYQQLENANYQLAKIDYDLNNNMAVINQNMAVINQNINELHKTVYNGFTVLDKQLDAANQNLINVRNSITVTNQIMKQGFTNLNDAVERNTRIMRQGFNNLNDTVERGFNITFYEMRSMNNNIVRGFDSTGKKLDSIGYKIDQTNEGIGLINNNIEFHGNRIYSSLDYVGDWLNSIDRGVQRQGEAINKRFDETNSNIDTARKDFLVLDNDLRSAVEAQSRLAYMSIVEQHNQSQKISDQSQVINEFVKEAQGGFEQIQNNLKDQEVSLYQMKLASTPAGKVATFFSKLTGKGIESIGEVFDIEDKDKENLIKKAEKASSKSPVRLGIKAAISAFGAVAETSVEGVFKEKAISAAFMEDKIRVLDIAKQTSKTEIPPSYQDMILRAENEGRFFEAIYELANYCKIDPRILTKAAKNIY